MSVARFFTRHHCPLMNSWQWQAVRSRFNGLSKNWCILSIRACWTSPVPNFVKQEDDSLLVRLKTDHSTLAEYCSGQICRGVVSGLTEAFVIDESVRQAILECNPAAVEIIKPFVNGRDIRRYCIEYKRLHLLYTFHGVQIKKYPAVEQHLRPFKGALLEKGHAVQEWYELQQPQHLPEADSWGKVHPRKSQVYRV